MHTSECPKQAYSQSLTALMPSVPCLKSIGYVWHSAQNWILYLIRTVEYTLNFEVNGENAQTNTWLQHWAAGRGRRGQGVCWSGTHQHLSSLRKGYLWRRKKMAGRGWGWLWNGREMPWARRAGRVVRPLLHSAYLGLWVFFATC